jgi:hypothetical protein
MGQPQPQPEPIVVYRVALESACCASSLVTTEGTGQDRHYVCGACGQPCLASTIRTTGFRGSPS